MKQIVITKENYVGLLADITEALAIKNINIISIDAMEIGRLAIFRVAVDEACYDKALRLLRDHHFEAIAEETLVIRLKDEPGALAKISKQFKEAGIDMQSIRILRRDEGWGLVAIGTNDIEAGKKLLGSLLI